jgi:hypothetical protein
MKGRVHCMCMYSVRPSEYVCVHIDVMNVWEAEPMPMSASCMLRMHACSYIQKNRKCCAECWVEGCCYTTVFSLSLRCLGIQFHCVSM